MRPFNTVKGEGFKQLAQGLIDIGAEHGIVDVNKILPHPSTISKKTSAVADRVRAEFLPEVKAALKKGTCAFETDMWTDKYTKRAYLTLDCQYSTPDFELKSLTLFTTEFPAEKKKSGENIRNVLESELLEMGFSLDDVKRATFNTDEGSNIKKALEEYERSCNAHVLATILRTIFDFDKSTSESFLFKNARECYDCISACKRAVVYVKRSGINLHLAKTVKMMVETRWNTLVDMLESVVAVLPEIIKLLEENKEEHKLDGWNTEIANQMIEFLKPFKDVSLELQAKKTPTLHLVLIRQADLMKHCEVDTENDHTVSNTYHYFSIFILASTIK